MPGISVSPGRSIVVVPGGTDSAGPHRRDPLALDQHLPARMRLGVGAVEHLRGAEQDRLRHRGGGEAERGEDDPFHVRGDLLAGRTDEG